MSAPRHQKRHSKKKNVSNRHDEKNKDLLQGPTNFAQATFFTPPRRESSEDVGTWM
jgi:hypothetical protein